MSKIEYDSENEAKINLETKISDIINVHKENHKKENISLTDNEYEFIKNECMLGF